MHTVYIISTVKLVNKLSDIMTRELFKFRTNQHLLFTAVQSSFFPRDATHSAELLRQCVRPSVCL